MIHAVGQFAGEIYEEGVVPASLENPDVERVWAWGSGFGAMEGGGGSQNCGFMIVFTMRILMSCVNGIEVDRIFSLKTNWEGRTVSDVEDHVHRLCITTAAA